MQATGLSAGRSYSSGYRATLSSFEVIGRFLSSFSIYGSIALVAAIGLGWKFVKGTRFHRSKDVDLASDLHFFDALTEHYRYESEAAPATVKDKILANFFLTPYERILFLACLSAFERYCKARS